MTSSEEGSKPPGKINYEWVSRGQQDVQCTICQCILYEPRHLGNHTCGHCFCVDCIDRYVTYAKQESRSLSCPTCRHPFEANQVAPNAAIKLVVQNTRIKCVCSWAGAISDFNNTHYSKCPKRPVTCECMKTQALSELKHHQAKECPNRTLTCKDCKTEFAFKNKETHGKACPMAKLVCKFCSVSMERCKMAIHRKFLCAGSRVQCPYCAIHVRRSNFTKHIMENKCTAITTFCPDCLLHMPTEAMVGHMANCIPRDRKLKYQVEMPPLSGTWVTCRVKSIDKDGNVLLMEKQDQPINIASKHIRKVVE